MNPNDQSQDAMQLQIDKRREDTLKEMWAILTPILQKPMEALSIADKGFLQARRDYLTKQQREEYKAVLAEDLSKKSLQEYTRNELNAKALSLGIENPQDLPTKQAVIDAINNVQ